MTDLCAPWRVWGTGPWVMGDRGVSRGVSSAMSSHGAVASAAPVPRCALSSDRRAVPRRAHRPPRGLAGGYFTVVLTPRLGIQGL